MFRGEVVFAVRCFEMRITIIVLLAVFAISFVGCSATSPEITQPGLNAPDSQAVRETSAPGGDSASQRVTWGVYELAFIPEEMKVVAIPARAEDAHYNVTGFVTPPACPDCIGVFIEGYNPDGWVYEIRVTLKNPTNLTGYDVRGTLLIGGASDPRKLMNADEYTELFDNSDPKDRNPFKVFAADQPARKFPPGLVYEVIYNISFPPPTNFNVLYVIDASWPGNQKEPFRIYNQAFDGPLDDEGVESAEVVAYVQDWQANIEYVKLDVTPLGAPEPIDLIHQAGDKWRADVVNEWSTPAGEYDLWIETKSDDNVVKLYDKVTLEIEGYVNTPPVWDDTIGITGATPGDAQVEVTYGTASDPNLPITYVVYYSETSPIDFGTASTVESDIGSPTVVEDLVNFQEYYFAVRARDSFGLEDSNIVEMAATPFFVNDPPVWDDTIGVQSLTPLSQAMEVGFGTASDTDVPVTYNIYYSETTPIDFGTASSLNVAASPGIVNSLDDAKTYFFAVRAMDSLGMEDDNTVEMSGCPNLPPVWQGPAGISGATGGFDFATVTFGTATDPDTPVTYTVYYSKTAPINFSTASTITGVTASPYKVTGLEHHENYHFAVRAVDALGLEDSNTMEAAAYVWSSPEVRWVHPFGGVVFSSPSYADVDGDNVLDIIVGGWNNQVKALDGDDGTPIWTFSGWDWFDSSPCIADVVGSDVPDVIIGGYDYRLHIIDGETGIPSLQVPVMGVVSSSPAIADVDDDGEREIIFGTLGGYIYKISETGSQEAQFDTGDGVFSSPALCDYNSDGIYEAFIGSRSGSLYCVSGAGGIKWIYPTGAPINSSPAIGDIDDDGALEVVFASLDGWVYALTMAGGLEWKHEVGGYVQTSPALGDFTGDGALDVVLGADNTAFYLLDGKTGDVIWDFPSGGRIWSSAAVVEMSGDGVLDVVVGSNDGYLWCIDGSSGEALWNYYAGSWVDSSPTVVDVDSDGYLEIVFGCVDGNVYCIDSNAPVQGASLCVWPKFRRGLDNSGQY